MARNGRDKPARGAPQPELVDEARETMREVPVAVGIVVAMQLVLAWLSLRDGWTLFHVHGWIWWVPILPELVLLGLVIRDRRAVIRHGGAMKVGD